VSPDNSTIPSLPNIVDAAGHVWEVVSGVIYVDGVAAGYTSAVTMLLYYGGSIYQQNIANQWWQWFSGAWVSIAHDPRLPDISAEDTTIPSATQIVDANYDIWTINAGHAAKNGVNVSTGSPAAFTLLLYHGGLIYGYNGTDWRKNDAAPWTVTTDPRATVAITRPAASAMTGSLCTVQGTSNQSTVTIKDGTTVLGTATVSGGTFSKQVRLNNAIGAHTLTVEAGSASASVGVTVGSPLPDKIFYGMNGHMCYADVPNWSSTAGQTNQLGLLQDLGCTMYRADTASATMANVIKTALSSGGVFYNKGIGFIPVLNGTSAGWTPSMTETAAYTLGFNLGAAVAGVLNGYVDYIETGNELDVPIKIGGNGASPGDWSQTTWGSYRGVTRGMIAGVKSVNTDIQVGANIGIPMAYGALKMLWNGTEPNLSTGHATARWDFTAYHWYESSGNIETAGLAPGVNIPQLLQDEFGVPTILTEWGWKGASSPNPATYTGNAMAQYRNDTNFRNKYNVICIMQYCMIDASYGLVLSDFSTKIAAYTTAKNFIAANPV
jgi:hypothetical protein